MVRGGVAQIADSRLDNLARIRRDGITVPLMLIRAHVAERDRRHDPLRGHQPQLRVDDDCCSGQSSTDARSHPRHRADDRPRRSPRRNSCRAEALDVVAEILPHRGHQTDRNRREPRVRRRHPADRRQPVESGLHSRRNHEAVLDRTADRFRRQYVLAATPRDGHDARGDQPSAFGCQHRTGRITYSPRTVRTAEQRCLHSHRGHHRGQGQAVAAVWSLRGRRIRPTPRLRQRGQAEPTPDLVHRPRRHLAGRLDPDRSASEGDQRQ